MSTAFAIGLALVLVAPLPFGGTVPASRGAFALAIAAGLALLWRERGALALPDRRLAALVVATAVLALAYLVPLPPVVVETLSPSLADVARESLAFPGEPEALAAAERSLATLAGLERPEPGWRTLSADPDGTFQGVTRILLVLGAFALGLLGTRTHRERRLLAALVVISAFVQAAYALVESFSGHQHILYRPKSDFAAIPSGTFVNPNHFAALLSLGLFAVVGLASRLPAQVDEEPPDRAARLTRAVLAITAAVVIVVALIWSTSRAALGAAAAGLVLLGAWFALREGRRGLSAALRVAPSLGLAVLLIAVAVWVRTPAPLIDEAERVPASLFSRVEVWKTTLTIVSEYPLTGTGPGTYRRLHDLNRPPEFALRLDHAHSDYLEWIAETGAAGAFLLLLWVVVIGLAVRAVLRLGRGVEVSAALAAALAALAVHEMFDFSLQLPGVSIPAALVAGALLAPVSWGPRPVVPGPRRRTSWSWALALLCSALACAGVVTLLQLRTLPDAPRPPSTWTTRLATAESMRTWSRGQLETVLGATREGRSLPREEVRGRVGGAVVALQRAAQRAPLRGELRMTSWLAADTLVGLTNAAADDALRGLARHYLLRAERLAPSSRERRLALARYWIEAGDPLEASRVVRELLQMDPGRAREAYEILGGARLRLDQLMEATPNRPGPALALARYLLDEREDRLAARVVLERSLARFPEETPLRVTLAGTLMGERRYGDALAVLDASPASEDVNTERQEWRLRARLYGILGQQEHEREAIAALESLGEDARLVALMRARSWLGTAREEEAIEMLESVVTGDRPGLSDGRRLEAALLLGEALDRRGELRGALQAYRAAARIDPDHPRVRAFLQQLETVNPEVSPGG